MGDMVAPRPAAAVRWWKDGPVFSTIATGDRIVALRPGQRGIGRLWLALLIAVAYAVVIVVVCVALIPRVHGVGSGVAAALALLAGLVLIMATFLCGDAASREETVGSALLWSATSVGAAVSALAWLGRAEQTWTVLKAGAVLVVAIGLGLANLVRLVRGVGSAIRQCTEITRLRETVPPVPGLITLVPAPTKTGTQPAIEGVQVTYTDTDGTVRRLPVALRTSLARVPLPGAPVLVWRDPDGSAYVEVDPDRPWDQTHLNPDTLKLRGESEPWWVDGPAFSVTGRDDVLALPPDGDRPLSRCQVTTMKTASGARGRALGSGIVMVAALALVGLFFWLEAPALGNLHGVFEFVAVLILPVFLTCVALIAAGFLITNIGQVRPRRRAEAEYRDQIVRLRRQGIRYPGRIIARPEPSTLAPVEVIGVEIGFDSPTGPRSVTVAMATTSTRVPLPGSPVIVYTTPDSTGPAYIEPDPARLMHYDLDDAKYSPSDSGGGS